MIKLESIYKILSESELEYVRKITLNAMNLELFFKILESRSGEKEVLEWNGYLYKNLIVPLYPAGVSMKTSNIAKLGLNYRARVFK